MRTVWDQNHAEAGFKNVTVKIVMHRRAHWGKHHVLITLGSPPAVLMTSLSQLYSVHNNEKCQKWKLRRGKLLAWCQVTYHMPILWKFYLYWKHTICWTHLFLNVWIAMATYPPVSCKYHFCFHWILLIPATFWPQKHSFLGLLTCQTPNFNVHVTSSMQLELLPLWSCSPVSSREAEQGIYMTTIGRNNETMREQPGEIPIGNTPVYI